MSKQKKKLCGVCCLVFVVAPVLFAMIIQNTYGQVQGQGPSPGPPQMRPEVMQYWIRWSQTAPNPPASALPDFKPLPWDDAEAKANMTLGRMSRNQKYTLLRGTGWPPIGGDFFSPDPGWYIGNTPAMPYFGIPSLNMADAANGFRSGDDVPQGTTTMFPGVLAMASTWDDQLVYDAATAIGREFRGKGANMLLGPSIQVHRCTYCGRNFEYIAGDDPYLGVRMTRAYVRAVNREKVMTVAKHFAFNEQETHRHEYNVDVDARTAWELYYPPFEAAVEEGVGAFMCAYNRVNSTHACTNEKLLDHDLRKIMGFRGFVQSDWIATYNYSDAPKFGLDQTMPGNDGVFNDDKLDKLEVGVIDRSARRVLTSIYRMRLNEDPVCEPLNCIAERKSNQSTAEHKTMAGVIATEAVTLLKNNGILPLSKERVRNIGIVGPAANPPPTALGGNPQMYYCGGGSGMVLTNPESIISPFQAISARAAELGFSISYIDQAQDLEHIDRIAQRADVIVAIGGTWSSEMVDRDVTDLAENANEVIFRAAELRPTIVLMQTPGAVRMPWLNQVDAIANLFLAGERTGIAWASLLFGDASPGGKLPIMFPLTERDGIHPDPRKSFAYDEGLFTSYRNPKNRAAFPFGHGLSYTTFDYGVPRVIEKGCQARICIGVTISNNGTRSGREVAQAYLEFTSAEDTPKRILRGFQKTKLLQAGESEDVMFSFTIRDLSIYNVVTHWTLQKYVIGHIGASSVDIRHVFDMTAYLSSKDA